MTVASRFAAALPPWCAPTRAEDLECALEALLFLAPEPLAVPELVRLLQHGEAAIVATLRRLTRRYAKRGLHIMEQQGRYRFVVAPTAEKAVLAYHHEPGFLSDAAYEALALVAYLQPITASRLLELQGTDGKHALQTLQDAGLVVGTPGEESRLFFRTTETFLTAAELTSLDELPPPLIWQESTAGNEHGVIPLRLLFRSSGTHGRGPLGGDRACLRTHRPPQRAGILSLDICHMSPATEAIPSSPVQERASSSSAPRRPFLKPLSLTRLKSCRLRIW